MLRSVRISRLLVLPLSLTTAITLGCGDGGGSGPGETPSLVLTTAALTMAEGGPTANIGVSLDKAPTTANDTLIVTVASLGNLGVAPASLTFTGNNYANPQTVTITPLQDANLTADVDTLTFTPTGLAATRVPVTIADNDVQAIVADRSTLALAEGEKDTVQVHLGFQPVAPVTVTVTASGSITAQPASLTFTAANYNAPQNVIVTGVHDNNLVPNTGSLALTATGVAPDVTVPATVADIDQEAIVLSTTDTSLTEGDSFTLLVHLAAQPLANVTVAFATSNGNAVSISAPTTFTFTPANFGTDHAFTINGNLDNNSINEVVSVTASSAGLPNVVLTVHMIDVP